MVQILRLGIAIFVGAPTWLYKAPQGLRQLLSYIKKNYADPEIYITENGWSEKDEDARIGKAALNDTERVDYYSEYINEALKASQLDGVNVKGMVFLLVFLKMLLTRQIFSYISSLHALKNNRSDKKDTKQFNLDNLRDPRVYRFK